MMKTVLAGAFMGLMTCAALAQAPAAPASNKPDVKTVQDWSVRCFPIASPSPCDMFQELDNQRTGQRVVGAARQSSG